MYTFTKNNILHDKLACCIHLTIPNDGIPNALCSNMYIFKISLF